MRYLKIYENYQTEAEVAKICQRYRILNWSINKDGLVDVGDDVDLSEMNLTELPLKFGIVTGCFDCSYNELTTLEGTPYSVDGDFICSYNNLTTLKGAPQSVGGGFWCNDNELTTLKGAPQSVVGGFSCNWNKLTTLEGAPQSVDEFYCYNNELTTLKGAPKSVNSNFNCNNNQLTTLEGAPYSVLAIDIDSSIGGIFRCSNNPLHPLIKNNITHINYILANQEMYHIYNKDGSLNEYRFQLMMDSMD